MRLNKKGMPETVKAAKLRKGETVAAFRKKQMILKWKDKKDVTLVSTTHDNRMETIETRNGQIEKPAVVLDYNKEMGGVDLADNYLFSYSMARSRLKKYYMKMFRHLIDICALNSFHVYKKLGGKKTRLQFLIELGELQIEKYATRTIIGSPVGRPSKSPKPSRLIGRHFPSVIPPTDKKQKPAKRCIVCYKKVQDIVFQLQRLISALSHYHNDCHAVMKTTNIFPIEVDLSKSTFHYAESSGVAVYQDEEEEEDEEDDEELLQAEEAKESAAQAQPNLLSG